LGRSLVFRGSELVGPNNESSRPAQGHTPVGRSARARGSTRYQFTGKSHIARAGIMMEAIRLTAYDVTFAAVAVVIAGAPFLIVVLLFG
jgi:hypothetical protein